MPLLLLLLGLVAYPIPTEGQDPVTVSVYYETKCPDSRRFVVNQLYPVWTDLKDIITLDVNCFGKSKAIPSGDGFVFVCQHGQVECEGNIMMTCAKKYIPTEDQFMAFTNCIMDKFVGAAAGPECAQDAGVDFTDINNCYNSVEGQQLQNEVGLKQATLDPSLTYVPWILINDVYTDDQLDAAQADLRKVVCEAYQGTPPPACSPNL